MGIFDFILGDEDTREALRNRSYLDPSAITDPTKREAAERAGRRMEYSRDFANMAAAMGQARAKGGKFWDQLTAGTTAFAGGGGEQQMTADRLRQAQLRNAQAQARQRELAGTLGGMLKGPSGRVGKGADGMIYEVWRDGSTHILPQSKMKGYAGQNVPPLDQVVSEVRTQTTDLIGRLNPNQATITGTGGSPTAAPRAATVPRPRTPEEADRLPPGTRFIDPNGVERVR